MDLSNFHAADLPKWHPQMCGYYGDPKRQCRCSVKQIETYRQRISGPLLDRIDLHVEVPIVDYREISSNSVSGNSSAVIRERVRAAREIQYGRFKKASAFTNSAMVSRLVCEHCKLDSEGAGYLESLMEQVGFSDGADDRILNVARTLADLGSSDDIGPNESLLSGGCCYAPRGASQFQQAAKVSGLVSPHFGQVCSSDGLLPDGRTVTAAEYLDHGLGLG